MELAEKKTHENYWTARSNYEETGDVMYLEKTTMLWKVMYHHTSLSLKQISMSSTEAHAAPPLHR